VTLRSLRFPACLGLVVALAVAARAEAPRSWAEDQALAVQYLKGYVRVDTSNPPGNEHAAARYLKDLLQNEGIAADILVSTPGRANLLARLPAAVPSPQPALLLLHHMDVVPADPAEWTVPPFEAVEKNGYVWGRGALDSKITGVVHVLTLARLKREGVPLNRDILLLAAADEENGGRWGTQWMLEKHGGRLKPGFVIDEGGFGFERALIDGDRPVYACAVEEKKVLGLRVTARGASRHASLPQDDNPIDILRRALRLVERAFARVRAGSSPALREMQAALPSLRKTPLTDALRHNTMAITSLQAWSGDPQNLKDNVIPAQAVATIDCRLLPGVNEFDVVHALRQAVDDDRVTIEITKRTQAEPPASGYRTPLYTALGKAIRRHDPAAKLVPMLYPAATDSRFFRAQGAVTYGLVPLVLRENDFYTLHAADERMPSDRVEKALRIMYDWVKTFCEARTTP
jgi:acetylornithine deacetylase/succinyl-diaminopimelate desuccinylase-like protein